MSAKPSVCVCVCARVYMVSWVRGSTHYQNTSTSKMPPTLTMLSAMLHHCRPRDDKVTQVAVVRRGWCRQLASLWQVVVKGKGEHISGLVLASILAIVLLNVLITRQPHPKVPSRDSSNLHHAMQRCQQSTHTARLVHMLCVAQQNDTLHQGLTLFVLVCIGNHVLRVISHCTDGCGAAAAGAAEVEVANHALRLHIQLQMGYCLDTLQHCGTEAKFAPRTLTTFNNRCDGGHINDVTTTT